MNDDDEVLGVSSSLAHLAIVDAVGIWSKLDQLTKCMICYEAMFAPCTLNCGHSYCYECIFQWIENAQKRSEEHGGPGIPTCPICRTEITTRPVANLGLQHMAEILVDAIEKHDESRAGVLSERRQSALDSMKEDVNTHGRLFPLLDFGQPLAAVVDEEDSVRRCPNCLWEMEGSTCAHCGQVARATIHTLLLDEDDEDLEDSDYHVPEDDDYSDDDGFVDHRDTDEILDEAGDFSRYDDSENEEMIRRLGGEGILDVDSDSNEHSDRSHIELEPADSMMSEYEIGDDGIQVVQQRTSRQSGQMVVDFGSDSDTGSDVEEVAAVSRDVAPMRRRPRIIEEDDE